MYKIFIRKAILHFINFSNVKHLKNILLQKVLGVLEFK